MRGLAWALTLGRHLVHSLTVKCCDQSILSTSAQQTPALHRGPAGPHSRMASPRPQLINRDTRGFTPWPSLLTALLPVQTRAQALPAQVRAPAPSELQYCALLTSAIPGEQSDDDACSCPHRP